MLIYFLSLSIFSDKLSSQMQKSLHNGKGSSLSCDQRDDTRLAFPVSSFTKWPIKKTRLQLKQGRVLL